jgi:hypothetical protein
MIKVALIGPAFAMLQSVPHAAGLCNQAGSAGIGGLPMSFEEAAPHRLITSGIPGVAIAIKRDGKLERCLCGGFRACEVQFPPIRHANNLMRSGRRHGGKRSGDQSRRGSAKAASGASSVVGQALKNAPNHTPLSQRGCRTPLSKQPREFSVCRSTRRP